MKMLAGDGDGDEAAPVDDSIAAEADAPPDEGFSAAADEVFSAMQTKDVDAFTSALKTCIDMAK